MSFGLEDDGPVPGPNRSSLYLEGTGLGSMNQIIIFKTNVYTLQFLTVVLFRFEMPQHLLGRRLVVLSDAIISNARSSSRSLFGPSIRTWT